MNADPLYLLALTYIPGVGPINQRKILQIAGPEELWKLSSRDLKKIFRKRKELADYFQSGKSIELAKREIEFCRRNEIEIITWDSPKYPRRLKECSDAPLVLFKKGSYEFDRKIQLAIVGTRQMTSYGRDFIRELIEGLPVQKFAVISGLAFGCDIEAHRNSIEKEIPNVAVVAHGLHRISPAGHKKEAKEIIKNGALLSEYSSFHNAEPINFILRNRIIAGLSDAVIVVESNKRGGALATAQYANSYNREVFAVPGRVKDKYSLGCNALIQRNQAYMIRGVSDLLEYFNLTSKPKVRQTQLFIEMDRDEKPVFEYLKKNGRQQMDALAIALDIPVHRLSAILLSLELKNAIKSFTGRFYGLD